jgi:hypothetical protein
MSGKSLTFSDALLKLIFQAVGIANIADNAATAPLTQLWVSLHTADPGSGGAQNTYEAAYGSYSRVAVLRSPTGFTVSSNQVTPVGLISFPAATSGSETETFFGIGTASTGAGLMLYSGPISPTIVVSNGVTPALSNSSSVTEG